MEAADDQCNWVHRWALSGLPVVGQWCPDYSDPQAITQGTVRQAQRPYRCTEVNQRINQFQLGHRCTLSGASVVAIALHHPATSSPPPLITFERTPMPRRGRTLQSDITANTALQCRAPNCTRRRVRISPHCAMHAIRRHRYGHAEGRVIRLKEIEFEHTQVSTFIHAQIGHPAVVAALKWLDQWGSNDSLPAALDMSRLRRHRVEPVAILIAATAIWIYSQRRPTRLPDDLRLTYAMSRAVLALVPRERRMVASRVGPSRSYCLRPGASSLRDIGGRMRRSLVAFFINVGNGLIEQERRSRAAVDALRVPFIA